MKKKILLFIILLTSAISANAADWQQINTDIPNFSMYIDKDTVKYINPQECLYAIKFQSAQRPEKVVYLKSNSYTNYLGVIRSEEFDENNYRPKAVFANVHVYMKPVDTDSFLVYAHKYVSRLIPSDVNSENEDMSVKKDAFTPDDTKVTNEPPTIRGRYESNNLKMKSVQKQTAALNLKDYVQEVGAILNDNWVPPKSGRNTQAIIILTIGSDGSLQSYHVAKSSGDVPTDRSIINSAEISVPYPKFPKLEKPSDILNLQFVFDYKKFKKSVI